jgi:hypothetical protein
MQLSWSGLRLLLETNIIEVRFKRRIPRPSSDWRRMLCTRCPLVLHSLPGRLSLKYVNPNGRGLNIDPKAYNLMPTWDLFWQSYRFISLDLYDIITVIPTRNEDELTKWWVYFNEEIYKMPSSEKDAFSYK